MDLDFREKLSNGNEKLCEFILLTLPHNNWECWYFKGIKHEAQRKD